MKQLITEPTRVTLTSGTTIDLIYASDELLHSHTGVICTTFSDHYAVYTVISLKHNQKMTKTHTKTKTRWFLRSIFLTNSSKCSQDPEKREFGVSLRRSSS